MKNDQSSEATKTTHGSDRSNETALSRLSMINYDDFAKKAPLSSIVLMRAAEKLVIAEFDQFARKADVGYSAFDDVFDRAEQLSVAAYATDADGFLIRYNHRAAELWGWLPPIGVQRWGGAWRLAHRDGRDRPMECSPMAIALRERRPVNECTVLGWRPDGSPLAMHPLAFPVRSRGVGMLGGVNLLLNVYERMKLERLHLNT